MAGLIPIGDLEAAGDLTTAANIRRADTQSQSAVDERIASQVGPLVADALDEDAGLHDTVALLAGTAVDEKVADLDLVEGSPLPRPAGVGISIPFADGTRSALEVDTRGFPTPEAAALHVEVEHSLMGEALGVETRTDIRIPGVRAIWAFEDDSIAMCLNSDGSLTAELPSPTPTVAAFVAYGDSTTEGADLDNKTADRWTTLLGAKIGHTVTNFGISGARGEEVAARIGGITVTATVTGGTVPASGTADLTNVQPDPWRMWDGAPSYQVEFLTDSEQHALGVASSSGATRRLAQAAGGSALTTARVETRAVVDRTPTLFLGIGINNKAQIEAGEMTVDDICALYAAITSVWKGRTIVWGVLDRGLSEDESTVWGQAIRKLEAWLAKTYGADYVPVRQYLASTQALVDALRFDPGFVPTSDDLAAQAAGAVPPCFRANPSTVHLGPLGHQLQARVFHRHMLLRGLI